MHKDPEGIGRRVCAISLLSYGPKVEAPGDVYHHHNVLFHVYKFFKNVFKNQDEKCAK
jgi:hypothetical protein